MSYFNYYYINLIFKILEYFLIIIRSKEICTYLYKKLIVYIINHDVCAIDYMI